MVRQGPYTRRMTTQPPGWSGGNPDDFTSLTLVRAFLAVRRTFVATLAPFEINPGQFNVLLHLVECPGMSQADLARVVLVTPQSVGELVRVMQDQELVERIPPARPGLPIAVHASPAGRALLDEVTPHVLAAFSPEALGLSTEAYERLNLDLHSILSALAT